MDTYGAENVVNPAASFMSSEDFAFMLQEKPGSYLMIGNGDTPMVHHPKYILDQEIFPIGANYWVSLAEAYLK
ncbi:M20/M25/M40 family metallo-hydrolase [uncultured Porphyromonas sp.]|uniref:M20/M25/M40 family metallo-hydrolase n=1 Tax=uncultured Porphyromonas sp. TaxID=159274 RepID=UPI00341E5FE1